MTRKQKQSEQQKPDWLDALETACRETSQTEVARRLCLSQSHLCSVVNGKTKPSRRLINSVRALVMSEPPCCLTMRGALVACAGCAHGGAA